ncbi:RagB/SusD family nutrient uptake outer membrane protein [Olivibacter sp. SDN3]|uniref:RagB/SusD family nutrient uptake outer membrane protein n=1 Tax=Olivibacter sp. SDN3 TaxID=2764720 RepID=UPI0016514C79|nr:RagB/SusD family nutrient uptake outer membrane protein [Olivibacter sp. SDN3]QNL48502.1 RagB/SusD family nutrient uptake outer membrane protein [Olivibacter sp. SDN3]
MKKYIYKWVLLIGILTFSNCKKDFLEREPLDSMTDDNFWSNEGNVETFSYRFYREFFMGYGAGYGWGPFWFGSQDMIDDFAPTAPAQFPLNVPTNDDANWNFESVRRANIYISRIPQVPMEEEAIQHWTGIARFFRGMAYADLVNAYGDVPWYDQELEEDDPELYRPRDPRTGVMDRVLEDFQFAAEHVRISDGTAKLSVNKDVVLAYMSKVFLFEGTWLKYHDIDQERAATYLEAAKWAADELISSGRYNLHADYREVFTSTDLSGNAEIILFRQYEAGILTHSHMSYNNRESQTGISRNAVESYLCDDGLPIELSPRYQGDRSIEQILANRDPRMTATLRSTLNVQGVHAPYSSSAYMSHKFLNDGLATLPEGSGSLNITDAPVMRYGEVLINYAEAAAELGNLTQEDLDKSINVLRARGGSEMPPLEVSGNQAMVNGAVYDDPERDPTVPGIIWEIRRERRIELMFEGQRYNDLRRWKKLEYVDTRGNETMNMGAWINKSDYSEPLNDLMLDRTGNEGYIVPAYRAESQRLFDNDKYYLDPLPIDQITLYRENGSELVQNPGW